MISNKYKYLEDKIVQISKLDKGWDGYSADPISDKIIKHAKYVLSSIVDEEFLSDVYIYPTSRDTIQFEYERNKVGYVELEIFKHKCSILYEYDECGNQLEVDIDTLDMSITMFKCMIKGK